MKTEHDKLLKENEVKSKVKYHWGEKSKSRHLVGRKQINYRFHNTKFINSI